MERLWSLLKMGFSWFERVGPIYLFLCFTVIPLVIIAFYVWEFRYRGLSDNPEHWAWFGSFLSGVLGPFVTLLTVLLLVISLIQTKKAIEISQGEMETNRIAQERTWEALRNQNDLSTKANYYQLVAESAGIYTGLAKETYEFFMRAKAEVDRLEETLSMYETNYDLTAPDVLLAYEALHVERIKHLKHKASFEGAYKMVNGIRGEVLAILERETRELIDNEKKHQQANSPADAS